MSILSGFFKTKKLRRMADGNYKLQSEWTSSETVEMADGNTAEENLGSIKGITSSLASIDSGYALAADAGKNLQDQVNELNSNLIEDLTHSATNISSGINYFRITRIKSLIIIELIISAGTTNGNLLTVPIDIEPKTSGIRQKLTGGITDKDKNVNMYFDNRVLKFQTSSAIETNVSGVYIYTI